MAQTTTEAEVQHDGRSGAEAIEVRNPATGQLVRTVPALSPQEVGELVARARRAQPGWEALGFEGRAKVLRRVQRWFVDNAEGVVRTIVSETGKPYEDAQMDEVLYAASALAYWAKRAPKHLRDERLRSGSPVVLGRKLVVRYAPVGVVGVIGPWNYPLTNSFGDCIPALAAGNSVVLKPASLTPLTSLLIEEALPTCGMPRDVFRVAVGRGDVGSELIDHVDYAMFTGSTEVGKKVMERAARTLTPVGLELGGKDPMIVLGDADLDRAANAAVWGSMQNGGQTCISIERAYVEEPAYHEFVAKVERRVRALRQGVPGEAGSVELGAITSPSQVEVIDSQVRDAVSKGARVVTGGRRGQGPGDFYEPTLLVDVDHSMECMTEETFGPVLPVMRVRDAEQALRLANDSRYGLSASVWTRDVAKGERLARRIEAGACSVNDALINYFALELPMGGWKASGLGSRHGADGIRKYTKKQALLVTRLAPRREPHMFPYRRLQTKLLGGVIRLLFGRGRRD